SSTFFRGGTDFYGRQAPTDLDLVAAFNDVVYSNVSLIANVMASTPINLYVTTDQYQARPKCQVRDISRKSLNSLTRTKRLGFGTKVQEVVSHPVQDILHNGALAYMDFVALTIIYLETCGNAYWHKSGVLNGEIPDDLFLIPPMLMKPKLDNRG